MSFFFNVEVVVGALGGWGGVGWEGDTLCSSSSHHPWDPCLIFTAKYEDAMDAVLVMVCQK